MMWASVGVQGKMPRTNNEGAGIGVSEVAAASLSIPFAHTLKRKPHSCEDQVRRMRMS